MEQFRIRMTAGGKYLAGLERRRHDEAELYLYGDYKRDDDMSLDQPDKERK